VAEVRMPAGGALKGTHPEQVAEDVSEAGGALDSFVHRLRAEQS